MADQEQALTPPETPGAADKSPGASHAKDAGAAKVPGAAAQQLGGAHNKPTAGPGPGGDRGAVNIPAEQWVIPFSSTPIAAPGERVIFSAYYTDPTPANYQIYYECHGGGTFGSKKGAANVTKQGVASGNVDFFVPTKFKDGDVLTVKMELQDKTNANQAVVTKYWSFSKKPYYAKTLTQQETEGERPLPSVYSYKVGPSVNQNGDSYIDHTILEAFGEQTSNLTPKDLDPTYAKTHNLTSKTSIMNHFWPGGSGNNGTFTVSAGDEIYDQHGGGMPDLQTFTPALKAPKEVHADLPQWYEAKPGTKMAKFTVRRILKTDGSKALKKFKK